MEHKASSHDADNANTQWPNEHHVMPVKTYLNVFYALILLTITTVISGKGIKFHPHVLNILVAMLIALVKAGLVIAFFMHQKFETRMNRLIFIAGFFALIIFIGLTSSDLMTRRHFVQNPKVFEDLKKDEEAHGLHPDGEVRVPQLPSDANALNPRGEIATDDKKDVPRPLSPPITGEAGKPASVTPAPPGPKAEVK
jgi:caa(3)-type oxidase subunit IV